MNRHPFADHRPVMIAIRRPLFQVLGTEAARVRGMSASHLKGHATRRAKIIAKLEELR